MSLSRKISKVAVLGSGIMGSRIACHFANIGLEVLLLDIVPKDLPENSPPSLCNKIVQESLANTLKSNPSPIYHKKFVERIQVGNFEDDLHRIATCDWTIEVIIENLELKKALFEKVELYRKKGTLITSNTSGIPIESMIEGRSEDFQKHFCGTHFFNPPRYLKLFEIIPSTKTDQDVLDFFIHYSTVFLGKVSVLCKDTPAFIANRIGVFSILSVFHLTKEMAMKIEDVDLLTGTLTGKPKSASFRTSDVVGLDTLVKVAQGIEQFCPNDSAKSMFKIPDFVHYLYENNYLGDKTGQGFYKKTKGSSGNSEILVLDIASKEYRVQEKSKFESVGVARKEEQLSKRLQILHSQEDVAALFLKKLNYSIFEYISFRIPEISDSIGQIDAAMKAGFGWEMGPFEIWETLGIGACTAEMKSMGYQVAPWIEEMIASDSLQFYKIVEGKKTEYNPKTKHYIRDENEPETIALDSLRKDHTVWSNSGCSLIDLGDGVLNVEFHTKMNAIGGEIIQGINHAIDIAEAGQFDAIVLGNDAVNFSAGANLAMIYMLALEQEYDELNMVIKMFQNTVMRLRYSSIPVVGAPHGLTLGGGCELMMHCDAVVAAAETYIGLVEVGVGLIPGGGGTKEMAVRVSDSTSSTEPILPQLAERFTAIATAKTATSAYEAFDIGVLQQHKDSVCVNSSRVLIEAKRKAIELAHKGYSKPLERKDILVQGKFGLAGLYAGISGFEIGGYASPYDKKIAQKIAWVLCGGDLSAPTLVSEQYLLDLEREAFLSLLGEKKTLERIQSILTTGKPLRN